MDTLQEERAALVAARDLIARGWTQGQYERHHWHGYSYYCTLGALQCVTKRHASNTIYRRCVNTMAHVIGVHDARGIAWWNDNTATQATVIAAFDRAIAMLDAELAATERLHAEFSTLIVAIPKSPHDEPPHGVPLAA